LAEEKVFLMHIFHTSWTIYGVILATLFAGNYSYGFEVARRNADLFLVGLDCAELEKETQSLSEWTKKTDNRKECLIQANPNANGLCEVRISDCIPNLVLKLHDFTPKHWGPNCWNTVLTMNKILPAIRKTTAKEMSFYLNSPLCRQLKDQETKNPGDIGNFQDYTFNRPIEYHSFIYISENMAFTKDGPSNRLPYLLRKTEDVFVGDYSMPLECRTSQLAKSCKKTLTYYRCSPIESFLNQKSEKFSELLELHNHFVDFEMHLQSQILLGQAGNDENRNKFLEVVNEFSIYRQKSMSLGVRDDKEHRFLLDVVVFKLVGIQDQFSGVGDETAFRKITELAPFVRDYWY